MIFNSQQDLIIALSVALVAAVLLVLLGFYLFLRTASALREANEELERQAIGVDRTERRLINILNSIPVALVETDTTGRFVFANRAAHQLLGRKDAELIGLRFHSATWGITYPDGRLIPPELLPAARALRGQTVKGFQHLIVNPNTRKRMLVSVTAMPIMNAAGEVIGSTAALVETEGLATPETARADEELARRYFDMAGVMLLALDAEGRVRDINAAGAELIGQPAADIVGQDWIGRYVPDEDRETARAFFTRVVEGAAEMPAEGETWIVRADGQRRLIAWKGAVARDIQGGFIASLSTGRDVTDQRAGDDRTARQVQDLEQRLARAETGLAAAETQRARTEAALVQAQRLETAGRLTGGAAQDFDRLLAVVGGALETLLLQADNPERVRRLGQAALAANRRGEQLSRRLLALTQPRAEDLTEADVEGLLQGMAQQLSREASGNLFRLTVGDDLGRVRVDVDQFEGALRNLVANAREAVGQGGSITVGAERAAAPEGQGLAPGDYVRVFVSDTGPGMNAETTARAPEAFFTTKAPAQHPGLGLSYVYGFARHAGGAAVIETEAGRGATVSLYLPLVTEAAEAAGETAVPREPAAADRAAASEDPEAPDAGGGQTDAGDGADLSDAMAETPAEAAAEADAPTAEAAEPAGEDPEPEPADETPTHP